MGPRWHHPDPLPMGTRETIEQVELPYPTDDYEEWAEGEEDEPLPPDEEELL